MNRDMWKRRRHGARHRSVFNLR